LNISSTLPYSDGSYKLEFDADLAQTYTMLDASTNCGWSQRLSWQSDYEYRIDNDWVNLVNPASMTDEDGNAHVMFAAWENFIDYTVAVYCGYTDDDGHHYIDTLYIEIVDNE
jgi:alpha-glucuronidase